MKKWYESKTVWFNVIATAAVILQAYTGKEILDPPMQTVLLAIVNFILRLITKHEIDWSKGDVN